MRNWILIFILLSSCSFKTTSNDSEKTSNKPSNYEFIIGKWKLITIETIDPNNLLPKIDSTKFNNLSKESNAFTFEFTNDTMMVNLKSGEEIKFMFEPNKNIKINDFETQDGYIYLPYKALFKKIDDNNFQIARAINDEKSLVIATYQRVEN